tara:strand:+ start:237 stop:440 length:204 start_codon:yes stop_codon:yes gene_type:complete
MEIQLQKESQIEYRRHKRMQSILLGMDDHIGSFFPKIKKGACDRNFKGSVDLVIEDIDAQNIYNSHT